MKISESVFTQHELVCIKYKAAGKDQEKWVEIRRRDKTSGGQELVSVTIGVDKEITAFDLEILAFLEKEGLLPTRR